MAHIEFDWVARQPIRAEHPLGSGTVVEYAPGDRVPANEWGQAAHHLEANDKICQIAINVADPGDTITADNENTGVAGDGLSDPTHRFLAFEGQSPLSAEEPTLEEPAEDEAAATEFPVHLGAGYYELSDGTKVRGKTTAATAQAELGDD